VHERRRGTGHGGGVHHQEHRRLEQLGDVGRGGELPVPALAVEEAHDALYDREEGVEVAAGAAGG
jgi:hypothetical protein